MPFIIVNSSLYDQYGLASAGIWSLHVRHSSVISCNPHQSGIFCCLFLNFLHLCTCCLSISINIAIFCLQFFYYMFCWFFHICKQLVKSLSTAHQNSFNNMATPATTTSTIPTTWQRNISITELEEIIIKFLEVSGITNNCLKWAVLLPSFYT